MHVNCQKEQYQLLLAERVFKTIFFLLFSHGIFFCLLSLARPCTIRNGSYFFPLKREKKKPIDYKNRMKTFTSEKEIINNDFFF